MHNLIKASLIAMLAVITINAQATPSDNQTQEIELIPVQDARTGQVIYIICDRLPYCEHEELMPVVKPSTVDKD